MNKPISRRHRRCRHHAVGRNNATMRNVHPSVLTQNWRICVRLASWAAPILSRAKSAIGAVADAHVLTVGNAALRPLRAKSGAVTRRTSQQDLAVVLIILNQIARGRPLLPERRGSSTPLPGSVSPGGVLAGRYREFLELSG